MYRSLLFCIFCIAIGKLNVQPARAQASSGPAECANSASGFSTEQRVEICKNGGTLETAKCANSASGFSREQRVELCKNGGTLETGRCANGASGFSDAQRVKLCSKSQD